MNCTKNRILSVVATLAFSNSQIISHDLFPTSTGAADTLATVDEEHPSNRFNDAKCDRLGRLWGGTMGFEDKPGVLSPHMGSLYSYDGGTVYNNCGNIFLMVSSCASPCVSTAISGHILHIPFLKIHHRYVMYCCCSYGIKITATANTQDKKWLSL